jgi:arylformamidase
MDFNNLVYLSHPYSESTPSYGNRDRVKITPNSAISAGQTANSSCWIFTNNHIGTHVDVPFHFDPEGRQIMDFSPVEWVFKNVALVEIPCEDAHLIDVYDFAQFSLNPDIDLLLIRTGFEKFRNTDQYWNNNPGIAPALANYLRQAFPNLRCIGFDFISITSWQHRDTGRASHVEFLRPSDKQQPLLAIEDMSLNKITGSIDWVIVAPLLVEDGNGSPVTIFSNIKE